MKRIAMLLTAAFLLAGCDYTEVPREIGYKGKARVNPWLAAERFCQHYPGTVRSLPAWVAPETSDAVWFVPAVVLSNKSYTRQLEHWITEGGHLVVLVDHAADLNDWALSREQPHLEGPLLTLLQDCGIRLEEKLQVTAKKIDFDGESFEVAADSTSGIRQDGDAKSVFATSEHGYGRVSVLTDSRLLRNRWIGENRNASLLDALVRVDGRVGNIVFMRGSGASLLELLGTHLWAVLTALALLLVLWLWKNFSRFGPLDASPPPVPSRGYERHLEALGDFQWRIDKGEGLLVPLRAIVLERGQRASVRANRRDDDFFQFLSDIANVPRDRVFRAVAGGPPSDAALLTRMTADLQSLIQSLHSA